MDMQAVSGAEQSTEPIEYVSAGKKGKKGGLSVDTDTFLQLLVAQLQYQDPLEPKKDSDFVAQLAQLTSLEEMQTMNQSLTASQGMRIVGKQIYAEVLNSDTGVTEIYEGIADSMIMQGGTTYAVVDNKAIPIDNVQMVGEDVGTNTQLQSMRQSLLATQAMGFVGKYVYAEVLNAETESIEPLDGVVESILLRDGSAYLVAGENLIPVESVLIVTESAADAPAEDNGAAEGAEPVEAAQQAEGAEPVEAAQPAEDTEPVEAAQPAEDTEPVEAAQPVEDTEPVEAASAAGRNTNVIVPAPLKGADWVPDKAK